jgi:hypothetical protein
MDSEQALEMSLEFRVEHQAGHLPRQRKLHLEQFFTKYHHLDTREQHGQVAQGLNLLPRITLQQVQGVQMLF